MNQTVIKPILTHTTNGIQRNKVNSMKMRFLIRTNGKTRMDRIRNETYREEFKIETKKETIHKEQFSW